ncbi:MAG: aldose 1-epimerase family protein [Eubacteriales bacterium]
MDKLKLMKYLGSVEQIGGIRNYTYNDGKAKGVHAIEVDTGSLRFTILPDRCMDIAHATYNGKAISWISKTGIVSPQFYEKDKLNWLRGFYGGLLTTCGLKNIGVPSGNEGLHGRIANIPAQNVSIFADWIDNDYVMRISGEMSESVVFGEHLVLKRTITAYLGESSLTVEDCIENRGFEAEEIALCYHCNFGYPLVSETARIVGVPDEHSKMSKPTHGIQEECINVPIDMDKVVVGIENNGIGAYITYDRNTLPDFLIWKMAGESDYVIGLEPRTTSLNGMENIIAQGKAVLISPFKTYKTKLQFNIRTL